MTLKDEKAVSILLRLTAEFIAREAGRSTLITPTRAEFRDRKHATVYLSVFPHEHGPHALSFLARNRDEFRAHLKRTSRYAILPVVDFAIDEGEQNRQRLDELSSEIEGA